MSDVTIKINDKEITVPEGTTILEAAKKLNIHIPTLCHLDLHDLKAVNQVASCRVCVVEVEGRNNLPPACATKVVKGMNIKTNTSKAVIARRTMVELLLSDHPNECLTCTRNTDCELQTLAADLNIRGRLKIDGEKNHYPMDASSKSIFRNPEKCVLCRRCETMCNKVQTCGILSAVDRGFETVVQPAFGMPLSETMCTFCGQCVAVCPTAALTEMTYIDKVWDAIHDDNKHVVVQTAPAVRVALGEEFGYDHGTIVTGKMVSLLRELGFDKVFDTNFAADVTIVEEASEIVNRIKNNGTLPILTSCCPAWVNFIEHQFPDLVDIPSTAKSPQQIFGALTKSYYAEKFNIDPKDIVVVSVMPCVAKKYESSREELETNGLKDVDYVITTRELASMTKEAGIDFRDLSDDACFDTPMGESTSAATIFGVTGGVLEAALRTAYEWLTNETLENVEFTQLRGFEGIREATVKIGNKNLNVAIAHGLGNARKVLESVKDGSKDYHAIEIMACPGGCIGGGGQPYHNGNEEILKKRTKAIYEEGKGRPKHKSHQNEDVIKLYKEYLGDFYGEKAHKLLHTSYTPKKLI